MKTRIALITALLFGLILWVGSGYRAHAQGVFNAQAYINVTSTQIPNNTTAIVVSAKPSALYGIEASNNSATVAFLKIYDAASGVTCGQTSPAPKARYSIPANSSQPITFNVNGDDYVNGITQCVTTGYADSDTTAPAATTYIVNVHWKNLTP